MRCLIEVEDRALHLAQGCASMFVYCTDVLHLCEGAAYNRIQAARTARRFPLVLERLADGSLTLTAVRLLGPHLTAGNCERVLASAVHATKRELEKLAATLAPKPDAPTVIRKLPQPPTASAVTPAANAPLAQPSEPPAPSPAPPPSPANARPVIQPLAPERYKLQLTIAKDTHDTLRQLQDLLRHSAAAARSGRSWNSITANPSRPAASRLSITSNCAAGRTTPTRRSCSSHVTRCGSVGRHGRGPTHSNLERALKRWTAVRGTSRPRQQAVDRPALRRRLLSAREGWVSSVRAGRQRATESVEVLRLCSSDRRFRLPEDAKARIGIPEWVLPGLF